MSIFKVGQKVVCKDASGCPELETNKVYNIHYIDCCPSCKVEGISIEPVGSIMSMCYCNNCRSTFLSHQTVTYRASRFEPLKYDIIPNKAILENMIEERIDIPIKEPEKVKQ